jgi:hypothetical protein
MCPPFCLTTACKRTLVFVTTFRQNSSETARHNFTIWALSCATCFVTLWNTLSLKNPHKKTTFPITHNANCSLFSLYIDVSLCKRYIKQYNFHLLTYSQPPVVHQFTNWWHLSHFPWTTAFTRTFVTSILWCYNFNGMIKWYDISCATLYITMYSQQNIHYRPVITFAHNKEISIWGKQRFEK